MRAVFDTNVFVSAFVVQGGKAERAFLLAERRPLDLFTSIAILTETARTLRVKFDQGEEDIKHVLRLGATPADLDFTPLRQPQNTADTRHEVWGQLCGPVAP